LTADLNGNLIVKGTIQNSSGTVTAVDNNGNVILKNAVQIYGSLPNQSYLGSAFSQLGDMTLSVITSGNPILLMFQGMLGAQGQGYYIDTSTVTDPSSGGQTTTYVVYPTGINCQIQLFRDGIALGQLLNLSGSEVVAQQIQDSLPVVTPTTLVYTNQQLIFLDFVNAGSHVYSVKWNAVLGPGSTNYASSNSFIECSETSCSISLVELG
jgi:hypothetical protein